MKITTYTPFQLRTSSDLDLVDDIINVINEAYHTVQPTEKRIKSTKGFYTYLGDTGLVAALGDETTGQVVACVSVKAWGEVCDKHILSPLLSLSPSSTCPFFCSLQASHIALSSPVSSFFGRKE